MARRILKPALWYADKQNRTIATDGNDPELPEIRAGTRSLSDVAGRECVPRPARRIPCQPSGAGRLSIDGKLTFSNNAYLKLPTEWIMLHGELAIGSVAAPLAPRLLRCGRHHGVNQERDTRPQNPQGRLTASAPSVAGADARGPEEPREILWFAKTSVASLLPRPGSISGDRCGFEGIRCH